MRSIVCGYLASFKRLDYVGLFCQLLQGLQVKMKKEVPCRSVVPMTIRKECTRAEKNWVYDDGVDSDIDLIQVRAPFKFSKITLRVSPDRWPETLARSSNLRKAYWRHIGENTVGAAMHESILESSSTFSGGCRLDHSLCIIRKVRES